MGDSTDKGGRNPRVTDQELLMVFRESDDPVLSTSEVADQLPIQRRATLTRLRAVEKQEELESKQIGGRNTVWWLATSSSASSDGGETLADRFGGFGMLEGEAGEEFAEAVRAGREEMNESMEERADDLFGE